MAMGFKNNQISSCGSEKRLQCEVPVSCTLTEPSMDPLAVSSGPVRIGVQHVTLAVWPLKADILSPVCASNAPHVPSAHAVTSRLIAQAKSKAFDRRYNVRSSLCRPVLSFIVHVHSPEQTPHNSWHMVYLDGEGVKQHTFLFVTNECPR
jgi:hypothetical protein